MSRPPARPRGMQIRMVSTPPRRDLTRSYDVVMDRGQDYYNNNNNRKRERTTLRKRERERCVWVFRNSRRYRKVRTVFRTFDVYTVNSCSKGPAVRSKGILSQFYTIQCIVWRKHVTKESCNNTICRCTFNLTRLRGFKAYDFFFIDFFFKPAR